VHYLDISFSDQFSQTTRIRPTSIAFREIPQRDHFKTLGLKLVPDDPSFA
jgi:hypothetical protein